MINFRYIKSITAVFFSALILTSGTICADYVNAQPVQAPAKTVQTIPNTEVVLPLSVVNSPKSYLNKKITMNARFDKFSTLGLDYKPAMRSSENYISFLIKRDDTKYDIPLSEMKLFLKRDLAEKFIDLKSDDEVKILGTVFSDALGDAWIDVDSLIVTKKAPDKDGVKK